MSYIKNVLQYLDETANRLPDKIAFADDNLTFDFKHPRKEIAKGALREFMPSGEREIIIPSR